jgi:broad specificity phosphatase PhoE
MGPELERLGVKRIITSPLRRAVGTAVIASADQDIEVIPEDELVEFNWGIARGMLVKKAFPPIVEQMASRGNHKFRHNPAAESNLAAHARVRSVVERYNQPGDLFMAHSWLLRAYFAVEVDRHRDELRQPEHKIGNAVLLAYRPGSRVWPRQVSAPPANLRAA